MKELVEFGGSNDELAAAERLMLANPVQFYQLYLSAMAVNKQREESQVGALQ